MSTEFTAEEVRKEADFLSTYSRKTSRMLSAYADTLSKPADSGRVGDDERQWRELLAIRVAGLMLYTDDGELSDTTTEPCIDFLRDSADTIACKLADRARAALAAQGQVEVPDGMQPSRPKPHMPVGLIGPEDFCFCNNEVSLQSVSGGGSPEGYLGSVRLKISGEFVRYTRESASPAGVPEEWNSVVRDALAVLKDVAQFHGQLPVGIYQHIQPRLAALLAAPFAPEGDGIVS